MADGTSRDIARPGLDLRTGRTVWELDPPPASPTEPLSHDLHTDVIVVGAGITGSFVAERLARTGRRVLVLDRREPRMGSTAASTALLQWEIDAPMLELEDRLGFDAAAAIYRRSLEAVRGIDGLVARLGPGGAHLEPRRTLYLAGTALDPQLLAEEHRLRRLAGLPGLLLDGAALKREFGLEREAAILSPGSAEADPLGLARLAMQAAIGAGAIVASPETVVEYDCGFEGVRVRTESGHEVAGDILVLATGYEMPPLVPARIHRILSTFALATVPQPAALWPERALIWEASEPYAYARTTIDGRIVFGGEDEAATDAAARDALLPEKIRTLSQRLGDLVPGASLELDAAWAGFFGETEDSLPLIGPVPGAPRCYAAFGYGGNGITFSALAAEMIATELAGARDPLADHFAIDR